MLPYKELKAEIITYLVGNGVSLDSFEDGESADALLSTSPVLSLRVAEKDAPQWQYFLKRLRQVNQEFQGGYHEGVFRVVFPGTPAPGGAVDMIKGMQDFHAALVRRYWTVAPKLDNFSVLVKPTHACNLDCKYCYDKPFRERIHGVMTMDMLERIIKMIAAYTEKVLWIWHGGEATMAGIDWFVQAYTEVFPKYPMVEFSFHMMTNGVKLDDEWLALAKQYKIQVGVSYNLNHQTELRVASQKHDLQERTQEYSDRILQTLLHWKEEDWPVGVIDVITSLNYKDQAAMYEEYKRLGIGAAMNHVFHTAQTEANHLEIGGKDYVDAFLKYFVHWLYDPTGVSERSASEALKLVVGSRDVTCTHADCRHRWIGFSPNGEMYPCDRYFPARYQMGNVQEGKRIEDVFQSEGYLHYVSETQKRFDTICAECGYWDVCRGGCNASAIESSGSAAGVEPFQCDQFRRKFDAVYALLRDVDPVFDSNLNPVARRIMLENGFYSVKEIRRFIEENGLNFPLEYDPNDLIHCSEYMVFRGVNYLRDTPAKTERHTDAILLQNEGDTAETARRRRKDLAVFLKEVAERVIHEKTAAPGSETDSQHGRAPRNGDVCI